MRLSNVELIQSTVIDVDDPAKQGRIKCVIPGVFENSKDKELYPWIPPFGMTRYQSFSKELCGAKVWVIQNKDNYNEFYFFPLFDKINKTKEFLDAKYDSNPEIVYMRDNCGLVSSLTYDEDDGSMNTVNDSFINIRPDGEIHIHTKNADVHLKNGNVFIGSDENSNHEPAVLGDKLCNILGDLCSAMTSLQSKASPNPYTSHLSDGFQQAVTALQPYSEIKCEKTKVN